MVERHCRYAALLAEKLRDEKDKGIAILNDVVLNQVLVRFHPPAGEEGDADALTREVVARVQAEGTCWAGGTTWHGRAAMRVSVSSWATTEEDVERSLAAIVRVAAGIGGVA